MPLHQRLERGLVAGATCLHQGTDSTVLVENTPRQCICNYGNAIYVPTFTGQNTAIEEKKFMERFKQFVVQLEQVENVRQVRKCDHPKGPNACYEQSWWKNNNPTLCLTDGIELEAFSGSGLRQLFNAEKGG
ncbi:expressed unknown protein [Seminavis robusta]|uniref:Uncharacterized protein n=1 Tax=Seminavis robusta TaxID=568900 RepID=A0A9N8H786_9STRA|nr:expressed unknown protein [Seminavis robusta]|eukprot:Sro63_g035650.1 n/a (132) ;mRNA; r:22430-22825